MFSKMTKVDFFYLLTFLGTLGLLYFTLITSTY